LNPLVQIIIVSHLACASIIAKCLRCDAIAIPDFMAIKAYFETLWRHRWRYQSESTWKFVHAWIHCKGH